MNFQQSSSEQGELFAKNCLLTLKLVGFDVVLTKFRTRDMRVEIDAVANNTQGIAVPFEFKGSFLGSRPGMLRSDTTKKAISTAFLFSLDEAAQTMAPLIVLTSHKPTKGSPAQWLSRVPRSILLDVLSLTDDRRQLEAYANMTEAEIKSLIGAQERATEIEKRRNGYYDCYHQTSLLKKAS